MVSDLILGLLDNQKQFLTFWYKIGKKSTRKLLSIMDDDFSGFVNSIQKRCNKNSLNHTKETKLDQENIQDTICNSIFLLPHKIFITGASKTSRLLQKTPGMTSFRDWPLAGPQIILQIQTGKLYLKEMCLIGYLRNLAILVQGKYLVYTC